MQLKLLYPRRSRFAPKSDKPEIQISNFEIRKNKEGYVKERCCAQNLSDSRHFVKKKR